MLARFICASLLVPIVAAVPAVVSAQVTPPFADKRVPFEEGFRVYRDHKYELEALYDNTTDHDVDAMAMMYLYYHPKGNEIITYPDSPSPTAAGS